MGHIGTVRHRYDVVPIPPLDLAGVDERSVPERTATPPAPDPIPALGLTPEPAPMPNSDPAR